MTYLFQFKSSRTLFGFIASIILLVGTLLSIQTISGQTGPATSIQIKAVGDIMPGTNYPANRLPPDNGTAIFNGVKTILAGADLLIGNMEGTITDYPTSPKASGKKNVYAFRSPPAYASHFKDAGFDVLNIANNHSGDFYPAGFEDTGRNLLKQGIETVGQKDKIVYKTINGKKTAIIGFSYFSRHNNINNIPESVALVKKAVKNSDIVIITFHGGKEGSDATRVPHEMERFLGEYRGDLIAFSHAMIDAGADLILGHGPHVPRALELYRGRLIAYSLGNFLGYRAFRLDGPLGLSLVLSVMIDGEGKFEGGQIYPVKLSADGLPFEDRSGESIALIRKLSALDFPGNGLKISDSGILTAR